MKGTEKKDVRTEIPYSTVFLAQHGDKKALDYVWDCCRPYTFWLAGKWKPFSTGITGWCDFDDLIQVGYLAFRHALGKWRPVEGADFKKYFGFWLKEYFRREIGISNSRRKEVLKEALSLNQKSKAESSGLDNAKEDWIEFEEDPNAEDAFKRIEDFDFGRSVREQVEKLPNPEKTAVKDFHFNGLMIKTIAKNLKVSPTSAARYLDNGYKLLRKNEVIQTLYAEIRDPGLNPYEKIGLSAFKLEKMSSPEWDYVVKEAFKEDLAKIFSGEEIDERDNE